MRSFNHLSGLANALFRGAFYLNDGDMGGEGGHNSYAVVDGGTAWSKTSRFQEAQSTSPYSYIQALGDWPAFRSVYAHAKCWWIPMDGTGRRGLVLAGNSVGSSEAADAKKRARVNGDKFRSTHAGTVRA